jgi:hypothetical protein
MIVAGQAYEGNCWTHYSRYYWDAWWSPISMSSGLNTTWDTAGTQGGNDVINDFTQLKNGNLVFVGRKSGSTGGVWAFVTDSIGKNLLWEKQFQITYKSEPPGAPLPLAVCATPDTGFTVVGEFSFNAFAAHFIPVAASGIHQKAPVSLQSTPIKAIVTKGFLKFVIPDNITSLTIHNAAGKQIAISDNTNKTEYDITHVGNGIYFYHLTTLQKTYTGKIVIGK